MVLARDPASVKLISKPRRVLAFVDGEFVRFISIADWVPPAVGVYVAVRSNISPVVWAVPVAIARRGVVVRDVEPVRLIDEFTSNSSFVESQASRAFGVTEPRSKVRLMFSVSADALSLFITQSAASVTPPETVPIKVVALTVSTYIVLNLTPEEPMFEFA